MSVHRVSAVVAAAGVSKRFSPHGKKQFATLAGEPLLAHSLRAFESSELVKNIVVVVPGDEIAHSRELLGDLGIEKITSIVGGGKKRQISVRNGFRATPPSSDIILIHDAARPFVDGDTIKKVIDGCVRAGACICAVAVTDTLKRQWGEEMSVLKTVPREGLWRAQTPQAFRREVLEEIYRSDALAKLDATDESALAEAMGIKVQIVEGSDLNMKITTAAEFKIAELIASNEGAFSVQNRNRV